MTELRNQINNIVQDHQECLVLAKSVGSSEVYEGTTATAEDIREGKTAYSNGERIVGIMKNTEAILSEEEPIGENRKQIWMEKPANFFKCGLSIIDISTDTGEYNSYELCDFVSTDDYTEVDGDTEYIVSYESSSSRFEGDQHKFEQIVVYEYDSNYNFLGHSYEIALSYKFKTKSKTKYVKCRFHTINEKENISIKKANISLYFLNQTDDEYIKLQTIIPEKTIYFPTIIITEDGVLNTSYAYITENGEIYMEDINQEV